MFGSGADIGIDLGTASVLIYIKGKGIVLQEPSIVAVHTKTGEVIAVGEQARAMLGRTPQNITAIRPLRRGVIDDYEATEKMLKYFIHKAIGPRLIKPRIAVCVPSGVTEVEKRAVEDATRQAGARKVDIIEEPIAAAIGAGIDISRPCGSMIVDIGGGTTDIAVISLGGTVVNKSIKTAGDNLDDAIAYYLKRKHNILIGERTAEEVKKTIGCAFKREVPVEMTPPELAADISDRGIVLTGGGSLIYGLDKLITEKIGINAVIADEAISCVAVGTGLFVEYKYSKNKKRNPYV